MECTYVNFVLRGTAGEISAAVRQNYGKFVLQKRSVNLNDNTHYAEFIGNVPKHTPFEVDIVPDVLKWYMVTFSTGRCIEVEAESVYAALSIVCHHDLESGKWIAKDNSRDVVRGISEAIK